MMDHQTDFKFNLENINIKSPNSIKEMYSIENEKRLNSLDLNTDLSNEEVAKTDTNDSDCPNEPKKEQDIDYQFDDVKYNPNSNQSNQNGTQSLYHNGNTNNSNNNNTSSVEIKNENFDTQNYQPDKYYETQTYENKNSNQENYNLNNGNYDSYNNCFDNFNYNDNNGMSVIPNDNPNSNQIDYPMSKENKLQDLNENNNPKSLIMTEDNSDILMSNDDNKAIFEMISYENINSNNNGSILMNEPNSNNPDQFNNGDAHIGIIGDDLNNCNYFILKNHFNLSILTLFF